MQLHSPFQHVMPFICWKPQVIVTPIHLFKTEICLFDIHHFVKFPWNQWHCMLLLMRGSNDLLTAGQVAIHLSLQIWCFIYKRTALSSGEISHKHSEPYQTALSYHNRPIFEYPNHRSSGTSQISYSQRPSSSTDVLSGTTQEASLRIIWQLLPMSSLSLFSRVELAISTQKRDNKQRRGKGL